MEVQCLPPVSTSSNELATPPTLSLSVDSCKVRPPHSITKVAKVARDNVIVNAATGRGKTLVDYVNSSSSFRTS